MPESTRNFREESLPPKDSLNVLPCPFCGGTTLFSPLEMSEAVAAELNHTFAVSCECGAQGGAGKTFSEAIAYGSAGRNRALEYKEEFAWRIRRHPRRDKLKGECQQ